MKSVGFEAIADAGARVLILGTLPSRESLERHEYYANARNSFWWIMGELVGASPELPYEDRIRRLRTSGIALWDVCRSAERAGSLDSKILLPSVELNDIRAFLCVHSEISLICFNGRPSEKLFRRKVLPLSADISALPREVLDSTSPAHTMKREEKLVRWRR